MDLKVRLKNGHLLHVPAGYVNLVFKMLALSIEVTFYPSLLHFELLLHSVGVQIMSADIERTVRFIENSLRHSFVQQ